MADLQNENLENMGNIDANLDKIEEMMDTDPNYVPSTKELLEMLNSADIDEKTKESLKSMLAGDVPQFFGGQGIGTTVAIVFVFIIFSVILFFGYKLYKSIKDKEKKREEKKKLKQMKKKK